MQGKKRSSKIQFTRIVIQILFFILLPGLYVNAFAGIKSVYQGFIQANLSLIEDLPTILGALSILPITLILGRFFCGWMCAFGALSDWLYFISNKVFRINFQISERNDKLLKYTKYIILLLFFVLIWNVDIDFLDSANPWNAFGILASVTELPDISYAMEYFAVGTILLLIIMAGSMLIERFFCRYFCPLGAVFVVFSRFGLIKVNKQRDNCGSCKLCTNICSMGIPLYQYDKVNSGECIQCSKCLNVCPQKNTSVAILGNEMNPNLAGAIAITAIAGIYYTGNLATNTLSSNTDSLAYSLEVESENGQYTDGIYEGTGTGFRGATTKVSVTVEDGLIKDIEVISHGDDAPYFNRAFDSVVSDIISSQSTDVDAVSGATYSSDGIMDAVADALNNTIVSQESETTIESVLETETTSEIQTTIVNQTTSSSSYADGTYEGTGVGFHRATTRLNVTILEGLITDIEVISYGDDAPYFNRAYNSVVSDIISSQSTDVDAVSGATYSSNGIMDAVADALENSML